MFQKKMIKSWYLQKEWTKKKVLSIFSRQMPQTQKQVTTQPIKLFSLTKNIPTGIAFFGDANFMHQDILCAATEEYLDDLLDRGQTLYVAMAQLFLLSTDSEGNLRRIKSSVKDAKKGGADLVCFPGEYIWILKLVDCCC